MLSYIPEFRIRNSACVDVKAATIFIEKYHKQMVLIIVLTPEVRKATTEPKRTYLRD